MDSANVALNPVVGAEVTVPVDGRVDCPDLISDRELHGIVDQTEVVRQSDGEAELIRGSAAGSVDVRGRNVGELQPPVERVPHRDALLVRNVSDANDAIDAA